MKKECLFFSMGIALLLLGFPIATALGNDETRNPPEPHFSVTLIASIDDDASSLLIQILKNESAKIGIWIKQTILYSNEGASSCLYQNIGHKTGDGGFDLGAFEWYSQTLSPKDLWRLYHSSNINPAIRSTNYFPCNDSALDEILDQMQSEQNFDQRKALMNQALSEIVWGIHPATGLYQVNSRFALDSEIGAFDPFRWGASPAPNLAEMYFENDGASIFVYGGQNGFQNLNPLLSINYCDRLIHGVVFSKTYELDSNFSYQPILATTDPIAIGSNDAIAAKIDSSTISDDSSYKTKSIWGPNPNVDGSLYDSNVTEDDNSMFLINLRRDIPWHPGYGYSLGEFNVTSDDLIWTLSYLLNEAINSPYLPLYQAYYGTNYTKSIEKINSTMVKLNLRGNLGNGAVADWFEALSITPLPQHVLDAAFNARPWGGDIGETPDGTQIASYSKHSSYTFNTGENAHSLVGTGPYTFSRQGGSYYDFIQNRRFYPNVLLEKFEDWGGYDETSLWLDPKYSANNIRAYAYNVVEDGAWAGLMLEDGDLDCIDQKFYPQSSLQSKPNIQVLNFTDLGMKTLAYNTLHPQLSNRFVRLAFSHIIPRQEILDDFFGGGGFVNEVFGLPRQSLHYPSESEWDLMALSEVNNTYDLAFQGHIDYDLEKAWTLMELAGYDMDPFRAYYGGPSSSQESETSSKASDGWNLAVVTMSLVITLAIRKKL